jgi:hypothetical protein
MLRTSALAARRVAVLTGLIALVGVGSARAEWNQTALGSAGEVYTVRRGAFGALFADAPQGAAGNVVLALDLVRDGKTTRSLVPGTEGPEDEQAPALALDAAAGAGYPFWLEGGRFHVAGYVGSAWQDAVELAGDPSTAKRNPSLVSSTVTYQRLADDGTMTTAKRTLVHVLWFDEGAGAERLLYAAAAIEAGKVIAAPGAFDLRDLAGGAPAVVNAIPAPAGLVQKPVLRRGKDNENVGLAFVDAPRGDLVTLELRPIDAGLLCFADKARAVIIDLGRTNPGLSRSALVDKARAVIIDLGRRALHPVVADFLSKAFLDTLAASSEMLELDAAAKGAWTSLIANGIALQSGGSASASHVTELMGPAADGSSRAVDVRWVSRRLLPVLPDTDFKLVLSPRAEEASLAWNAPAAVRYRETNPLGWDPVNNLYLTPTLTREQAYKLVEQRLDEQ